MSSHAHVTRLVVARPIAVLVAMALAVVSLGVAAPPAAAVGSSVVLRSLVVSGGTNAFAADAMAAELKRQGIPFTLVDLSDGGRPTIDADFLEDDAAGRGRFQAVFLSNREGGGLTTDELAALAAYEVEYGVRQVNGFEQPSAAVGLTLATSGNADGAPITVTTEGHAGPFSYLRSDAEILIDDINPNPEGLETFGYVGAPVDPMPAGQSYTPLLNLTLNGQTGPVVGVFSEGGREEMVVSASPNKQFQWFNTIAEGIVSWATRGINLGYQRNYFNVHVDDVFLADARWSVDDNCTPGEDCLDPTVTTPDILMTAADVTRLTNWQAANGLQLDMVFNAYGTTDPDGPEGPEVPPTALVNAFLGAQVAVPLDQPHVEPHVLRLHPDAAAGDRRAVVLCDDGRRGQWRGRDADRPGCARCPRRRGVLGHAGRDRGPDPAEPRLGCRQLAAQLRPRRARHRRAQRPVLPPPAADRQPEAGPGAGRQGDRPHGV